MKKHVVGISFVLTKTHSEGMAKKVEVQEKGQVEGLLTTFLFKFCLFLKDSPYFYEQNQTTIISKKYK